MREGVRDPEKIAQGGGREFFNRISLELSHVSGRRLSTAVIQVVDVESICSLFYLSPPLERLQYIEQLCAKLCFIYAMVRSSVIVRTERNDIIYSVRTAFR